MVGKPDCSPLACHGLVPPKGVATAAGDGGPRIFLINWFDKIRSYAIMSWLSENRPRVARRDAAR